MKRDGGDKVRQSSVWILKRFNEDIKEQNNFKLEEQQIKNIKNIPSNQLV